MLGESFFLFLFIIQFACVYSVTVTDEIVVGIYHVIEGVIAAAISGNNQRELMIHMAGNFLAGIGIALTAGGFFLKRKKQ